MKKKRIVVALGGNALGNTPQGQIEAVRKAASAIAALISQGHEIIIGHGNGPQVGMINSALDFASAAGPKIPYIPFAECGAMSQGYIGYHLQQALQESFRKHGLHKTVVSVATQVLVSPGDPAFRCPTKPIGNFYTKEEADRISSSKGWVFMEDSGRGYRRVVPSPKPQKIIELNAIRRMLQSGLIVIAAGGGGIPVIQTSEGLKGIDAVIDKDRSCARLALELKADILLILTAVDSVYINYRKPDQKKLGVLTLSEARRYINEGQFAAGSMLPKVEACMDFVSALPGRTAVITSLDQAGRALEKGIGTRICSAAIPGETKRRGQKDALVVDLNRAE